jgi:hypothetical protein
VVIQVMTEEIHIPSFAFDRHPSAFWIVFRWVRFWNGPDRYIMGIR